MLITLLTDFGTADYFVGAIKGVILSADAGLRIVDVSHEIPPHDIRAAAFTLIAVYADFPEPAVHLAVVDPGVGSPRRPIVVEARGHRFVGPDNGLFSYVLDREPGARIHHVQDERCFRHPLSTTFHGRDIFAPVAAALAAGTPAAELGPQVDDPVRLPPLRPRLQADGVLEAAIIHIDRFGNCVTSLTPDDLGPAGERRRLALEVAGRQIRSLRRFYAEPGSQPGELFGIWGSAGFLEIAADRGSAARLLGVERGEPVGVRELAG